MPSLPLNVRAKLVGGFGVVLLCSTVVNAAAYVNTVHNVSTDDWVRHTQEVLTAATTAELTIQSMESSYREYLLTGNPVAAAAYRRSADQYPAQLQALAQLTSDNPPQVARWQTLESETDQMRNGVMEPGIALRQRVLKGEQKVDDILNYDAAGSEGAAMAQIRDGFGQGIQVENQLLVERTRTADEANSTLQTMLIWGTLLTLLLGVIIAYTLASGIGYAMHRLASTARAIAAGDLARRIDLNRSDELGQAAAAFDAMAAKLESDIAERERIQLQTDSILNSAAEGIFSIDTQGHATSVNPAVLRLTGYTLDELLGSDMHALIHHSRADGTPVPREDCSLGQAMVEATTRQVKDEVYWRKDGTSFPVEYTVVPMLENGKATGAVVSFHDISERLAVERMKDEFVSVVSHELRTPLTSIRGSLGLLAAGLMGPISDKAQHMLHVALTNTDRLIRLINDILDLERINSGRVPMEMRRVDVRELVLRCFEVMRPVADDAGVTLIEEAEAISVRADPDRLLQTLTNLVSNAIKFSPASAGSSVRVRVYREHPHGDAHFAVEDRGRGIPTDKLHTIFGRFEQVDASDSRDKGGTGLGLAISHSIVTQHGGRIWDESVLGQGSTFHFVIPIDRVESSTQPDAGDSGRRLSDSTLAPMGRRELGPARILIVEDDADLTRVMGELFAQHGVQVDYAGSAEEAVERSSWFQPDLLLLDLSLPGKGGADVVDWFRRDEHLRHVALVVYTARDLDERERERLKLGPTEYFTKSRVSTDEVRQCVLRLLERIAPVGERESCEHQAHTHR